MLLDTSMISYIKYSILGALGILQRKRLGNQAYWESHVESLRGEEGQGEFPILQNWVTSCLLMTEEDLL